MPFEEVKRPTGALVAAGGEGTADKLRWWRHPEKIGLVQCGVTCTPKLVHRLGGGQKRKQRKIALDIGRGGKVAGVRVPQVG